MEEEAIILFWDRTNCNYAGIIVVIRGACMSGDSKIIRRVEMSLLNENINYKNKLLNEDTFMCIIISESETFMDYLRSYELSKFWKFVSVFCTKWDV